MIFELRGLEGGFPLDLSSRPFGYALLILLLFSLAAMVLISQCRIPYKHPLKRFSFCFALQVLPLMAFLGGAFLCCFALSKSNSTDFEFPYYLLAWMTPLAMAGILSGGGRRKFRGGGFLPRWPSAGLFRQSLAMKMLLALICLSLFAGGLIFTINWLLLRDFARESAGREMEQAAIQIGSAIPDFIRTGRTLTQAYADELSSFIGDPILIEEGLEQRLNRYPFYSRLIALNHHGEPMAQTGGPSSQSGFTIEFMDALADASAGIPVQVVLPPEPGQQAAQLIFLAPVLAEDRAEIWGVLAGWTDLSLNPFMRPAFDRMKAFSPGAAYLVDETGRVIVHADRSRIMTNSEVDIEGGRGLLTAEIDGSKHMLYSYAVAGYPWYVVVEQPHATPDGQALSLNLRIFVVMAAAALIIIAFLYGIGRQYTRPLREMADIAESIAHGRLDREVSFEGADEVGLLATAFERMRTALRAKLNEMDLLLAVSQSVASSLDLSKVLPPIIEGIRELTEADLVRLILVSEQEGSPATEGYQAGQDPGNWSELDGQVLQLSKERGYFILENPSRAQALLNLNRLEADLEALMALPIINEDQFLGCIWVGHRSPYAFLGSERNLLLIIAGQLGVAIANARSYRRAEQERKQLEAILEAAPEAIIVTSEEGRIALANPASEALLAVPAKAACGKSISEGIAIPEVAEWILNLEGGAKTGEISLEGGRSLFATITPIPSGEQGLSAGHICVLWDITRYKKLEMLKSELVATVSHNLRKPLTLMRGYASMLSMVGPLNEQQRRYDQKVSASIDQMTELVDHLLDLGRIEAGLGLSREEINVERILDEVLQIYRPFAVAKQITLAVDIQEGMKPIVVDPTLIQQALANLVDNAIIYTPANGRVSVRASQSGEVQSISVEDSGVGIAPADQARLFEKFYRVHREQAADEERPGLGLAIAKSIVEQHGGRVLVSSRLGTGSAFTVELPIHPNPATQEGAEGRPVSDNPKASA